MRRSGDYDVWSTTTYRLKFVELRQNSSNFSRNLTGTNFWFYMEIGGIGHRFSTSATPKSHYKGYNDEMTFDEVSCTHFDHLNFHQLNVSVTILITLIFHQLSVSVDILITFIFISLLCA